MASRLILERILRDEDDTTGQTVRQWYLRIDDGSHLVISRGELVDSESERIRMTLADATQFIADLETLLGAADVND